MQPSTLAIIGAGFSAQSLLRQLSTSQAGIGAALLFGREAEFGQGIAYGPSCAGSLLNTRAADLGLCPERPGEFADWAQLEGKARDRFLTRAHYGRFLTEALAQTRESAGFTIDCYPQAVVAIRREESRFTLHLADATRRSADHVVLATGALPAPPLPIEGADRLHAPGYVDDPWHEPWLEALNPDARVGIIGTGLSMIDHVQRLRAAGHRAPIVAISRHGLLPRPHLPDRAALAALPEAVERAITGGSPRDLLGALRTAALPDWQPLVDALRPRLPSIWKRWPDSERQRFLRHLRSHWEVHRHRLAPDLHAEVQRWIGDGGLQIVSARVLELANRGAQVEVSLCPRGSRETTRLAFDCLLRATGIDAPLRAGASPLFDSLLQHGLVSADPAGFGITTDSRQRVLDPSGQPVPGLFALGAMTRGREWEATAIPELRLQAQTLAALLSETRHAAVA